MTGRQWRPYIIGENFCNLKLIDINLNRFLFIGQVASGLPDIKIPPMHTTIGNQTLDTLDMITHVGSSIIALPMISILESIAVAKAFCKYRLQIKLIDIESF